MFAKPGLRKSDTKIKKRLGYRLIWSSTKVTNELKLLKPVQEFKPRSIQELHKAAMASGKDKFTPDIPPAIKPWYIHDGPKGCDRSLYVAFGHSESNLI